MPITNPLLGSPRSLPVQTVVVDPTRLPGVQNISGVNVNPLTGAGVTQLVQQSADQQLEQINAFAAQQAAANAQTIADANTFVDQRAQMTGINPLTGQPVPGWKPPVSPGAAEAAAADDTGDFMRGLSTYIPQTKGILAGALGLGLDKLGAEEVSQGLLQSAAAAFEETKALGRTNDSFTNAIKPEGSLVDWAQFVIGQQTGNLLESAAVAVAGGAVGAAAGTAATGGVGAPVGAPVGAAVAGGASLLGRTLVKKKLRDAIQSELLESVAEQTARGIAVDVAQNTAAAAARRKLGQAAGRSVGQAGALLATAGTRGVGEIVQQAQEAGLDPTEISNFDLATGAGVYALAEALSDKLLLDSFSKATGVRGRVARGVTRGVGVGTVEGGTEVLQDSATGLAAGTGLPGAGAAVDAFAAGFLGGGAIAGAAGAARGSEPNPLVTPAPVVTPPVVTPAATVPPLQITGPVAPGPVTTQPAPDPVLPTGFDALSRSEQADFAVRANAAVGKVNAALKKAGARVPGEGATLTDIPMQFTASDFLSDPEAVINLADAAGVNVTGLISARNLLNEAVPRAEARTQMRASIDPVFISTYSRMDATDKRRMAEEMGWDAAELDAIVASGPTVESENRPAAIATRVAEAFGNVRQASREQYEQEQVAFAAVAEGEARRTNRQRDDEDALWEEQQEQARVAREAADTAQTAEQQAALNELILGRPAPAPTQPMTPAQQTRAFNAFMAGGTDPLPADTSQFVTTNPLFAPALLQAYRLNSTSRVVAVLDQIGRGRSAEAAAARAESARLSGATAGSTRRPKR